MAKVRQPKPCGICKKPFTPLYDFEDLCDDCRKKLPTCDVCRCVICSGHGYHESSSRHVGEYRICGGCSTELRKKGYLRISESERLLRNGRVKVSGRKPLPHTEEKTKAS